MTEVAAVILAAGQASRFRAAAGAAGPTTKLVADYNGAPLVLHVARAALASQARPVLVVTGHAETDVRRALAGLPLQFVHNADYAQGISTSVRAGIAALPPQVDGALVLLADMPRVTAPLLDRLIETYALNPQTQAVVPCVDGRRGNPVLLARPLFSAIATLAGDVGARPLLQLAGEAIVDVPIEGDAAAFDVDTPESLQG